MPWRTPIHKPHIQATEHRARERERGSPHVRGYTRAWYEASRNYLRMHPMCVHCAEVGRVSPSQVTDHKVPHRGDMQLFWDTSNWQALCAICHNTKTGQGE